VSPMLASRFSPLACRLARRGRPAAPNSRPLSGFFQNLKENISKEIDKNPELKKTMQELRENESLAKASEAARDASAKVSQAAASAADVAGKGVAQAADVASERAAQAANAGEEIASKAAEQAKQAQQAAAEATHKFTGASAADGSQAQQRKWEASGADDAAGAGAGAVAGTESKPSPPPFFEQLSSDIGSAFEKLKQSLSSGGGSAAADAAAAAPSGAGDGPPGDPNAGALVVREPTFWERNFNPESPFFERLRGMFGGAGDAAGGIGDRVFGETEQAEAMAELRTMMPEYSQEEFLSMISKDMGPEIIGAFLKGDIEPIRAQTRDQAFATLQASVTDRITRQLRMDPRILYMSPPELEGMRIIGGMPTVIVSFETHQIYCMRNASTGAIAEGDEDDIRSFHYLWALQPNEQSDAEHKWQVTELAVRGVMSVY